MQYLEEKTFAKERELFEAFFEAGVYVEPASAYFCRTPGYFRVLFTLPKDLTIKGLKALFFRNIIL